MKNIKELKAESIGCLAPAIEARKKIKTLKDVIKLIDEIDTTHKGNWALEELKARIEG